MARGRPGGNPNIKNLGKKFQKGKSGNADSPIKSYSYRNMFRYLAAQEIDMENLDAEIKRLLKPGGLRSGIKTTVARAVAVRTIERVLKKMEPALLQQLIDNTEGKLTQEIIIPSTENAPDLDGMTLAEAAAIFKAHIAK